MSAATFSGDTFCLYRLQWCCSPSRRHLPFTETVHYLCLKLPPIWHSAVYYIFTTKIDVRASWPSQSAGPLSFLSASLIKTLTLSLTSLPPSVFLQWTKPWWTYILSGVFARIMSRFKLFLYEIKISTSQDINLLPGLQFFVDLLFLRFAPHSIKESSEKKNKVCGLNLMSKKHVWSVHYCCLPVTSCSIFITLAYLSETEISLQPLLCTCSR